MQDGEQAALKVAQHIKARPSVLAVLTVIIAAAGFFLPRYQPYFFSFEHKHADLRTSMLSPRMNTVYDRLVFVAITEAELEQMVYRSPVDRAWLANLVTVVDAQGPSVIAIDIQFDQVTEPEKDQKLIDAIRAAKAPIVVAAMDDRDALAGNTAGISAKQKASHRSFLKDSGASSGFVNASADEDDIIRELPVAKDPNHPLSFADVVVNAATGEMPPKPGYKERIAWLRDLDHKKSVFPGKPASAVMLAPDRFNLKGNVVLIGADLRSTDKHKTPFAGQGRVKKGTSGSRILAQIIAQKLDGRRVTMLSPYFEFILYLIASMAGFLITASPSGLARKAKIFTLLGTAALLTDLFFFKFFSVLVPTAMVLFTLSLAAGLPSLYVKLKSWGQFIKSRTGKNS